MKATVRTAATACVDGIIKNCAKLCEGGEGQAVLAVVLPVMLSLGICSRVENVRELALGGMVGLGCNVLRLVSCIAPLRYYASPNLFKFLIKFKPVEYLNLRLHFFIFTFFLNLASEASRCNCTEWVRATSYWTVLHVRQVTGMQTLSKPTSSNWMLCTMVCLLEQAIR